MGATRETRLVETPDSAEERKPSDAFRAFAQLLARLAADRSVSDALTPDAGTDETASATAGQTATVV